MTDPAAPAPIQEPQDDGAPSFYVTDKELHRRMARHLGEDAWKAALKVCERDPTFPRFKSLWRGRFLPAVEAWLLKDNGMMPNATIDQQPAAVEDGREDFGAAPQRKTRPQEGPQQPAVLDRQAGGDRPDGVRGRVHPFARPVR